MLHVIHDSFLLVKLKPWPHTQHLGDGKDVVVGSGCSIRLLESGV
jgi:hypothetical protein